MKQKDHYREILRLISGIGRLTNPQHLPALSEHGVSLSQFLVLDALSAVGGPVRMAELARLAGVTSTELSRIVASLEAQSAMVREADPEDSRARLAKSTAHGRKLQRDVQRQATVELRGVWDAFTHDEWHRFIDYLSRFEAALRRERDPKQTANVKKTSRSRRKEQP